MIDQNQPYNGENINPAETAAPIGQETVGSPIASAVPPVEITPDVPSVSSVIVPQNGAEVPKWFYFIFGITLIVFLVVTTLLVLQITKKEAPSANIAPTTILQITPSVTINAVSPTVAQTTESAADDIASIEADLKTIDLTVLDTSLNEVDKEASF